jgi:CheY-like chemotaxis protein
MTSPTGVKTILVVDDDHSIVELLALFLELEGYAVLTASNGKEALERARGIVPGLIVTDQMMPVMTGEELFRALKRSPRLRQVPVILMTSALPRTARDLQWAELIRKPMDLEVISRAVHRVFREACESSALA